MRGNPAPDAIADPTWGEWDDTAHTLTLDLGLPGVWSWNNNYEGTLVFLAAYLNGMKYVFHFNEAKTHALITSPMFRGAFLFTDLVYGTGAKFEMVLEEPEGQIWVRKSYLPDGMTKAFDDYKPTQIVTCDSGTQWKYMNLALKSIKDHSTFDPDSELIGGATSSQLVRR